MALVNLDPKDRFATHIQRIKDFNFNEAWADTDRQAGMYSGPPKPKRIESPDRRTLRLGYHKLLNTLLFWFTTVKGGSLNASLVFSDEEFQMVRPLIENLVSKGQCSPEELRRSNQG